MSEKFLFTIFCLISFLSLLIQGRQISIPTKVKSPHSHVRDDVSDYMSAEKYINEYNCARIYNSFDAEIDLEQNKFYGNLSVYNFLPNSIQMRKGCRLTLQDDWGTVSQHYHSVSPGCQCWDRPISVACCECHGCLGADTPIENTGCAMLYSAEFCSICQGSSIMVNEDQKVPEIETELQGQISSVIVRPGCDLEIFEFDNFEGGAAVVNGIVEVLPPDWNNRIGSYKCSCKYASTQQKQPWTTTKAHVSTISTRAPIATAQTRTTDNPDNAFTFY